MGEADLPSVVADGYHDIGLLDDLTLEVMNPASVVGAGPIVAQGMGVEDQWFSGSRPDFQTGLCGHPVVGMNHLEVDIVGS